MLTGCNLEGLQRADAALRPESLRAAPFMFPEMGLGWRESDAVTSQDQSRGEGNIKSGYFDSRPVPSGTSITRPAESGDSQEPITH